MDLQSKPDSAEAAARRAQIVAAARTLFEERGLSHTSVMDITEAVGVTRSLFYHYFSDKDAVTAAVLDDYVAEFREMVDFWNASRETLNVRKALHDCITMLRRGVFDKGSFRADLARNENASLYLQFAARTAEVLARHLTDTTAVEYARHHELEIDNLYEMFYVLIIGMVGFIRRYPDASDEVLESLVAQTLHLDLDNTALLDPSGPER